MYQALYRKYRPKTLDDICGQETIVKILKNSINKNQINHAYLFSGPRGTGKTSVAKILAKIVNCEKLKDCIPCNKCKSCTENNNSDIIEIDAASNNGVDEIRELKNKVNLVPSYGKYKIYIVDEVHMLTVGAFNALLKTLEEPPNHIIFILATTDPQKIPETIISRCQRFDFKKINNKDIVENLKKISKLENIKIEAEALSEIARLSDGGMRDSIGMLDQAKSYTETKITAEDVHDINGTITDNDLKNLLEFISNNNIEKIMKKTDEYNDKGKNFNKLLEEFINYLRNILLYQKVPHYMKEEMYNTEPYESISSKIESKKIFKYIEILNKYSKEMKISDNQKLMFELAIIEILDIDDYTDFKENNQNKAIAKENTVKKTINNTSKIDNSIKNANNTKDNLSDKALNKEKTEEDKKIKEFIKYIKKIRIDNTLSKFNKKTLIELKNILNIKLDELLLNSDYSYTSSILLDGQLKAASSENMVFVYKTDRTALTFNKNLLQLEKTVEKALNKKYNLIATDTDEWEKIKDEYNNKKRTFVYKKEDFNIEEVLKLESGDIITTFEDIIEFN